MLPLRSFVSIYTALRAVRPSYQGPKRRGFEVATYETHRLMMTPPTCERECQHHTCTQASFRASACARRCACTWAVQVRSVSRYCVCLYWKDGQHDATIEQLDAGDPGPNSPLEECSIGHSPQSPPALHKPALKQYLNTGRRRKALTVADVP